MTWPSVTTINILKQNYLLVILGGQFDMKSANEGQWRLLSLQNYLPLQHNTLTCCPYKTLCHYSTIHSLALTLCTSEAGNCGNIRNTSLDRQCITYTFYMHENCIQKFIRETWRVYSIWKIYEKIKWRAVSIGSHTSEMWNCGVALTGLG